MVKGDLPRRDYKGEMLTGKKYTAAAEEKLRELRSIPRVIKTSEIAWEGNVKRIANPGPHKGIESMRIFFARHPPNSRSIKHGHQNEAVFYILEGRGYGIHDGERLDYKAGDAVIVQAGCVHQHFNEDPSKDCTALVINPKPVYLDLHLIFQRTVETVPGGGTE